MTTLIVIGHILFGGYFIYSGWNHFAHMKMLTGYAQSKNIPAPAMMTAVSGALMILGGLLVFFNIQVTVGAILLLIFMLPTTYFMHQFWTVKDPAAQMTERIMFMKNVAIIGAMLMMVGM
jgi:uncharacterized membrane protein YphA (DoxX/SURF4 family)